MTFSLKIYPVIIFFSIISFFQYTRKESQTPPHSFKSSAPLAQISHELIVANAKRRIDERIAWLRIPEFAAAPPKDSYFLFSPYMQCPGTFEKVPGVSLVKDGGKWICGLQELATQRVAAPCIVYSFGCGGNYDFEKRVHELAPTCVIHTFDPTWKADAKTPPFVSFHDDFGLGAVDGVSDSGTNGNGLFTTFTLPSIMSNLVHSTVDILKVDIEGFEWSFIKSVDWASVKVGQLSIEFHPDNLGGPKRADDFQTYFAALERGGLYTASVEPVTSSNFGQSEYVFLHRDWSPSGWRIV